MDSMEFCNYFIESALPTPIQLTLIKHGILHVEKTNIRFIKVNRVMKYKYTNAHRKRSAKLLFSRTKQTQRTNTQI